MVLQFTKRISKAFIPFLSGIFVLGALFQFVGTKIDEQRFPPIGRLVDVGGYRLHINVTGKNDLLADGTTVVLDAGMGCNCLDWALVQPEIARMARVVSYDRAGYGWSDDSPLPRTSENIAYELHTLLQNAGMKPPYILVGHSFGGLNTRVFEQLYPDEVKAVVLVDAA
ncbi:MAG TPA: alpha/beta hydrolase, partial [Chlamydiales bacterium]|nr:alpha/beta hydrolase [Chlamydiales bacterium]